MKTRVLNVTIALLIVFQLFAAVPTLATEATENEEVTTSVKANETPSEPIDIELPEKADDFLTFVGYQVRETDYNGLRSIFKFDITKAPSLDTEGYEVIEYGTIMASETRLSQNGDELIYEKGDDGEYYSPSYAWQKTIWAKDGGYLGNLISHSDESVEYACTVTNFSLSNFDLNVSIRAYAIVADLSGNEYVLYSDYPDSAYRSVNLGQICDALFANGTITKSAKSYSDVVIFRDEKAWGPTWKP